MSEQIGQQPGNLVNPALAEIRTSHFRPKYAGFWIRFWAYTIDLLIISAISGIVVKPIFRAADLQLANPPFLLFSPYKVIFLILFLLYFALMTKFLQQTVGKMIMGIRVEPKEGQQLTWGAVLFREVIGRFISKILVIPYLLVVIMPKKEALHDLFGETVVVHEDAFEIEPRLDGQQLPEGTVI